MKFLREHWYDLAGGFAVIVLIAVFVNRDHLTAYRLLMWFSLAALFFHQLEEYRIVGTFPGMLNAVIYGSDAPDRYPLNTNTAFYVNVVLGWSAYLLAAVFAERAVWLGMATILISLANVVAHTFYFNIKGRTIYNAGMASGLLFFVPCIYYFFRITHQNSLAEHRDYLIAIPLAVILNGLGILKLIHWMADRNTPFTFGHRHLLRQHRSG